MALPQLTCRLGHSTTAQHGPITIVAFGDSVTQGATRKGELELGHVYHARLKRMLERRWPKDVFNVINAGIGGETAADGLKRINRDVVRYQPDLLTISFGLNDAMSPDITESKHDADLTALIDTARAGTSADILLLTSTFMATRESDQVHEEHLGLVGAMTRVQNDGRLAGFAQAARRAAERAGVVLADVYAAWEDLAQAGTDTTALLANGLNHPTGAAHQIAAEVVFGCIEHGTS